MEILTVGHGNQAIEEFISLLRLHGVEIIVDTRSTPFSQRNPQFSKQVLAKVLDDSGVKYVYLGDKLGGRPRDPLLYTQAGKPDYDLIGSTVSYKEGIEFLESLAKDGDTVAILCSESDYRECHRFKLLSRTLTIDGVEVRHIMRDGSLQENPAPQLAFEIAP